MSYKTQTCVNADSADFRLCVLWTGCARLTVGEKARRALHTRLCSHNTRRRVWAPDKAGRACSTSTTARGVFVRTQLALVAIVRVTVTTWREACIASAVGD